MLRTSLIAAAILAGGLMTRPAAAADSTISHAHLTLTGQVAVSASAVFCAEPDTVVIQPGSEVNVVAVLKKRGSFVHIALANVMGLGELLPPQSYIGTGTQKFTDVQIPAAGAALTLQATFELIHTEDGCADSPLPVTVNLFFTADGKLDGTTSTATAGP
jgi:hypothetical protein